MFALIALLFSCFAVGWRAARADDLLDAFGSHGTAFQGPTNLYAQVHTADPGANGTTAVANAGRRRQVTFAASAAGVKLSNADVLWAATAGPGTPDFTHFTLWDSVTAGAGNCWGAGTIGSNPIPAGEDFTISTGNFRLSVPVMAGA